MSATILFKTDGVVPQSTVRLAAIQRWAPDPRSPGSSILFLIGGDCALIRETCEEITKKVEAAEGGNWKQEVLDYLATLANNSFEPRQLWEAFNDLEAQVRNS